MNWLQTARGWAQNSGPMFASEPKIGLALGGGFARGIAHIGVLRVFEREEIPIRFVAGVSAGSLVAAAYASGANADEIEAIARTMRFKDVARWTLNRLGLAGSERMAIFLQRLLKASHFEDMKVPLAVVATDLSTGTPAVFRDRGDVVMPIRASCAYPGLFTPICENGRCLVDGMVSMEVPALPLRQMGATHVISVALPNAETFDADNMFSVISRSFQLISKRTEREWRRHSNLVIEPCVGNVSWDGFLNSKELIACGERSAEAALPAIRRWLKPQNSLRPIAVPDLAGVTRSSQGLSLAD
jgi:NTE family protein